MSWYYAKDKAKVGPIEETELDRLLQNGAITAQTLVWTEGMPTWRPYSEARSSAAAVRTGHSPVCAECGQTFPPEQLITLAGRSICSACKPVAVQKFQEGVVSFSQTADAEELWRTIQMRGYDFTIGSVLSRSWKLITGNFWPCVGITLLCYIIMMGANQIPFLGLLAVFLVQPQIMAGLSWYFLKQFRGESATLNDAFAGFRRGFGQQALYMVIVFALIIGVIMICAVPLAFAIPALTSSLKSGGDSSGLLITVIVVFGCALVLAIWYFMLSWIFTSLLILDKGLTAIAAMKLSWRVSHMHLWKILGLCIVIGVLSALSLLALIVGVFVMLPVAFASITRLYEDAFGGEGAVAKT